MLFYTIFVLSIILNFALAFVAWNTLRKLERFEDYFGALQGALTNVLNSIRSVDIRGAFEADDEVGLVFKGILGMILSLEEFTVKESDGQTEKTTTRN